MGPVSFTAPLLVMRHLMSTKSLYIWQHAHTKAKVGNWKVEPFSVLELSLDLCLYSGALSVVGWEKE